MIGGSSVTGPPGKSGSGSVWSRSKTAVRRNCVRGRIRGSAPAWVHCSMAFLEGGTGAQMRRAFSPLRRAAVAIIPWNDHYALATFRCVVHVDVLVLHGSPGSGKTTLSRVVSELLREADLAHAVIDLDDLNMVYPSPPRSFARANLRAIWPNYAAIPDLRLILPSVIADQEELEHLRGAVPGSRFVVCELTAPEAVLKERVTSREPNEFWRQRLRGFVDLFHARSDLEEIRDFWVSTHDRSIEESAREVVEKAGWQQAERLPLARNSAPVGPAPEVAARARSGGPGRPVGHAWGTEPPHGWCR